VKTGMMFYSR